MKWLSTNGIRWTEVFDHEAGNNSQLIKSNFKREAWNTDKKWNKNDDQYELENNTVLNFTALIKLHN